MAVRIQVILSEEDAALFKSQARKEASSLSAWLRKAGRRVLDMSREKQSLNNAESLKQFFQQCNKREKGQEPSWRDHKKIILDGYKVDLP